MIVWEWIPSGSIRKSYGRFIGAPPSGTEYGPVTRYDQLPPIVTVQLEAKHVPSDEFQVIRNLALRRKQVATFILTMPDPATGGGVTITGVINDISWRCEEGTWDYTIHVEVERTDLNVAQATIVDLPSSGGLHL